jgi:hypothetical protein
MEKEKPPVSSTRFAREIGLHPATVRDMARRGEIAGSFVGKKKTLKIPFWQLEQSKAALNSRGSGVTK